MKNFTFYDSGGSQNKKTKRWLVLLTLSMMMFAGMISFAQVTGSTCDNSLLVSSMPFNDSGSTSVYGNNYTTSDVPQIAPGAVTTGTGANNYLGNGNDVVYSYTAGEQAQ